MASNESPDLRSDPRYFSAGRVSDINNNLLGFLSDLSSNGAQFWIDIENKDKDLNIVKISPIEDETGETFTLEVEPVRRIEYNTFVEVGVRIVKINNQKAFDTFLKNLQDKNGGE